MNNVNGRACKMITVWEIIVTAVNDWRLLQGLSEERKRKIFTED